MGKVIKSIEISNKKDYILPRMQLIADGAITQMIQSSCYSRSVSPKKSKDEELFGERETS